MNDWPDFIRSSSEELPSAPLTGTHGWHEKADEIFPAFNIPWPAWV